MKAKLINFSNNVTELVSSPFAFVIAMLVILSWLFSGPYLHYSDTWQLIANTFTTLITFLMGFIIQSSQQRNSRALHLKLDELIRVLDARNDLIDLENEPDEVIDKFADELKELKVNN